MKKKHIISLMVGIIMLASCIPVLAAPKQMSDGNMFDAEYYATNNPDVASVFGTDENLLYSHYINCGKNEGRKPYADGVVIPKFDAVYYATHNPDVVAVLGTDETILYNHYITCGKNEGRIPCENGTPFMEVELSHTSNMESTIADKVILQPFQIMNEGGYCVYYVMGADGGRNYDAREKCASVASANTGTIVKNTGGGMYDWFYGYNQCDENGIYGFFYPLFEVDGNFIWYERVNGTMVQHIEPK